MTKTAKMSRQQTMDQLIAERSPEQPGDLTMTNTDLMNLLIDESEARAENERRIRFAAARSNTEKLFHMGVLTTPDDEMERSFQYTHAEEQAKLAGVSTSAMLDAIDYCRAASNVIEELGRIFDQGETDDEGWVRIRAAAEAAPGPVPPGMKKSCLHRSTKKTGGLWIRQYGEFEAEYHCSRCGAVLRIARRPERPTEAALEAGRLHALLRNGRMTGADAVRIAHAQYGLGPAMAIAIFSTCDNDREFFDMCQHELEG